MWFVADAKVSEHLPHKAAESVQGRFGGQDREISDEQSSGRARIRWYGGREIVRRCRFGNTAAREKTQLRQVCADTETASSKIYSWYSWWEGSLSSRQKSYLQKIRISFFFNFFMYTLSTKLTCKINHTREPCFINRNAHI